MAKSMSAKESKGELIDWGLIKWKGLEKKVFRAMAQPCSQEIVVVAAQQLERQPTNLEVVGLNAKLLSSYSLLSPLQNNLS